MNLLIRIRNSRFASRLKFLLRNDPVGFVKTIVFNLRYLPFSQAKRFPVFISSRTHIEKCRLSFYKGCGQTGDLTFGFVDKQYIYPKPCHLCIEGTIITKGYGMHDFGPGTIISISKDAVLVLGNNFASSYDLQIKVADRIEVGQNNMWSYGIEIRDTDSHSIFGDAGGGRINPNKPIILGDNVWIGCRTTIMKGVYIASNTIIAASSIVSKSQEEMNTIISSDGKILKHFNHWSR